MNRRTLLKLLAAGLLVPRFARTDASVVMAADAFVDSIGVSLHLFFADTPYYTKFQTLKEKLISAGIRYGRGVVTYNSFFTPYYDHNLDLVAAGIKCIFMVPYGTTEAEIVGFTEKNMGGAANLYGYEGPNEYDTNGGSWADDLRAYLPTIWAMRRHNSLPIIAPAIALYGHDRYTALGDISAYVDYSNCHDYILYPGTPPWGDDGYAPLPYHLLNGSIQAPGKPMVATETGWHTDPTVLNWVSETAQAKYIVRMLLEHQRVGIVRTWLYEMIDLPGSGTSNHGLGLLHSDMTEKPAFKAVKNIIATLRDPGTPIATTALDYSLTGGDANVRSMAFQKRNGSCWVAIWDEKSSWDFNRNTDITNTPQSVTLTVTGRVEIVRTHALQSDGTLITAATAHGQSLALTATDTVQFVEIAPRPEVQPTILGAAV